MWICDFLRTGQHVVLCSLYSEQSKPPTDVKQFFYHLLFPGFDSLLSTFCSADTLLWTRPARGDRCLGCFSFDSFVYKNITVPSVSSSPFSFKPWKTPRSLAKLHTNPYTWLKVTTLLTFICMLRVFIYQILFQFSPLLFDANMDDSLTGKDDCWV
jgi:hypothetical protein